MPDDPCPDDIVPCGIKIYSPCPAYGVRTWRRNTQCPNDYQQFIPSNSPEDCEQQPCRFAIYVGNENAITDDDMRVMLNGIEIMQLHEVDVSCQQRTCRGHLILPASVAPATPAIFGGGGPGLEFCTGEPIALQYYYSAALDGLPPGAINTVQLLTLKDNNCGNYGRFVVYQVCKFDGVIQLQPEVIGLYASELHQPLTSQLQFSSDCLPCCRREKRQPAKGVKVHVLIPKVKVHEDPTLGKIKMAEDVASYELYFDSHGKLDKMKYACAKIPLGVLVSISCEECALSARGGKVAFAPGIVYADGPPTVQECCE